MVDSNWTFTTPSSGSYVVYRFGTVYKFPTIPRLKKSIKKHTLRLEINYEDCYYVYRSADLVNILYQSEWQSKKNPQFKVLELLFGG